MRSPSRQAIVYAALLALSLPIPVLLVDMKAVPQTANVSVSPAARGESPAPRRAVRARFFLRMVSPSGLVQLES